MASGQKMTKRKSEFLIILFIFALSFLLFWPTTFGGKTLLPVDNLFAFEPWRSFAEGLGVSVPHNELLSDLILENYVWKRFIVESIRARDIPLWNPYLFAGLPFLAAGQHSALYPLSIFFYILTIPKAYGYFTVLQLFLAGLFTYIYARTIGLNRLGSLVAGIAYMLSAFMIVSVVFTMIIAAAAWLPLLLAIVERIIQREEELRRDITHPPRQGPFRASPTLYVALGAIVLGVHFLAGHIEISGYVLLVTAFYAVCRLGGLWWRERARGSKTGRRIGRLAFWLAVMVVLGLGLGAVQFIPLYEVLGLNFRQGSADYQRVIGWAFPPRRIIAFLVPNFFGNPAHHSYLDLFTGQTVPITVNAYGGPNPNGPGCSDWGIKNYVEGGSYMGLLPLLLAVVAILGQLHRSSLFHRYVWPFTILALLSLSFIFGTPLYTLLYYGLPGWSQLHTPFRWIFPYTLSLAVLAGIGADHLTRTRIPDLGAEAYPQLSWPLRWFVLKARPSVITIVAGLAFWGGVAAVVGLILSRAFYAHIAPWVERAFWSLAKAPEAFPDARAFYSYEFRQLLLFGLLLAASGIVLRISRCPICLPHPLGRRPIWEMLALIVLVLDLFAFGYGFNPAADPKLLDFKPPVVDFLQGDTELYRLTSFVAPGEKTFLANVGMFYKLSDIRGYDSIFPKQYADYMGLIEEQDELLFNRIAPLSEYDSLDSRLLDLLNVKYVLTTRHIPNPGYELVYDGEIRVYRNEDYLPRVFIVPRAVVVSQDQLAEELKSFDPREYVVLEEQQVASGEQQTASDRYPVSRIQPQATVTDYTINEVTISVTLPYTGWLVLADSYFPDWKAYDRSSGFKSETLNLEPETLSLGPETELKIYRANGNFRAVQLGPGEHGVRFKYTPMSFKLGLYTSFMAGVVTLLLSAYWLWRRYYRESEEDSTVKRVAKNSLTPMVLSLLNKLIDMAFAMLMLRILTPEGAGRYQFAVTFVTFFEILTRFGLGTLLTREVAKDRPQANRYLSNVCILRLFLWFLSLPLMALLLLPYVRFGKVTSDTMTAIGLFAVGLLFSLVADALSSLFYAFEKMEYPAILSTATTIVKVSLGAMVLLPPLSWGFVGLAAVSILSNIFTAAVLLYLMVRHFFRLHLKFEPAFEREMLAISLPLMINHLLQTIFFRIDIWILQPMQGNAAVGLYGAALKYIDGLNIIPSLFTIAIFPLMSRYAHSARESLIRAYILSLRLLLIVALPVAVGTPFIARELILILGGGDYLPDSMIALQLLIGFFPFSCINQVTQYVLIAIDQQRFLTKAFVIGVAFNVVTNLLFIPVYSYKAAAVITIFSEVVLLIPFYYCVRKNLTVIPWLSIFWQPALSSAVMGAFMWLMRDVYFILIIPLAALVYFVALVLLGTFQDEDMKLVMRLIPLGSLKTKIAIWPIADSKRS